MLNDNDSSRHFGIFSWVRYKLKRQLLFNSNLYFQPLSASQPLSPCLSFSFSSFGGYSLPFIRCSSSGNRPSICCSGRPVHFLQHVSKRVSQQGLFIAADRLISCGHNTAQQLRVMSGMWTNILRQHLASKQKQKRAHTNRHTPLVFPILLLGLGAYALSVTHRGGSLWTRAAQSDARVLVCGLVCMCRCKHTKKESRPLS